MVIPLYSFDSDADISFAPMKTIAIINTIEIKREIFVNALRMHSVLYAKKEIVELTITRTVP